MKKLDKGLAITIVAFLLLNSLGVSHSQAAKQKKKLFIGVKSDKWKTPSFLEDYKADAWDSTNCSGGQYSRWTQGMPVRITNQNGKLIKVGTTEWYVDDVVESEMAYLPGLEYTGICVLIVKLTGLPKASIYQIKIGQVDGGAYTYKQLVKFKWDISLEAY